MKPSPDRSAGRDVVVDDDLREIGRRQLQHGVGNDCRQRNRDLRLVRAEVGEQPPHQAGVVRFAEDFFFVNGH